MENKIYKITDLIGEKELLNRKVKEINTGEIYIVKEKTIETTSGKNIIDEWELHNIFGMGFRLIEETKPKEAIHETAKIYIAGSLFNEAEISQRLKEENLLRECGYNNIFNPIAAPCNNKSNLPTSKDIFWGDTSQILDSDIVVADLSNQLDLGVACELGIVWTINWLYQLNELHEGELKIEDVFDLVPRKKVIAHLSDIRKRTSHKYQGNNIPWGINQYLIACVEDMGIIKDNFAEVLEELK